MRIDRGWEYVLAPVAGAQAVVVISRAATAAVASRWQLPASRWQLPASSSAAAGLQSAVAEERF